MCVDELSVPYGVAHLASLSYAWINFFGVAMLVKTFSVTDFVLTYLLPAVLF
jgi:hypothetical protein